MADSSRRYPHFFSCRSTKTSHFTHSGEIFCACKNPFEAAREYSVLAKKESGFTSALFYAGGAYIAFQGLRFTEPTSSAYLRYRDVLLLVGAHSNQCMSHPPLLGIL